MLRVIRAGRPRRDGSLDDLKVFAILLVDRGDGVASRIDRILDRNTTKHSPLLHVLARMHAVGTHYRNRE